nr:hypothetical transcript [Hymenolepis microstoma]
MTDLSYLSTLNIEKLEEIDMIVGCGSVPLSSILADHGVQNMSQVGRGSPTALISNVKLYVGGLRRTHTEEHLKGHFESKYGPLVECRVVKDFKTKESRGFGFVTFREAIHASRALAEFPNFIEGVPIQVRPYKFANANRNKAPLGDASSQQTKQKPPRHRVVVVGVSDTTTKDAIKTALSKIGPVINVDKEPNRGFATVNFEKPEAVDQAVLLSQIRINDNDCEIYPYNVGKKVIRDREGGEKGSSEEVDELRLFVGNLNPSNIEKLEEIDMIVGCGSVPLSSILADHGVQNMSQVGRGSPTALISNVKLYVGGLRRTHTEEHLKGHFESKYGPLVECRVVKDFKTKESRGFGFVTFREAIHASRALAEFPNFIEGVPIQVRPYKFANANRNKAPLGDASSQQTKQKPPRHRVVVVGVSDTTTKDAIKTALSKIGPVINVDKEPNRGFATVNFEKPEAVDQAVLLSQIRINDNDCEIYPYNVGKKVIRDREGGEKGSSEEVDELRLFVGNLNPSVSRKMLKEHFSRFGSVTKVDIIYDHGSSKPRGMAFVSMSTVQEVEAVLKARPHILDSKEVIVRKAYKKKSDMHHATVVRCPLPLPSTSKSDPPPAEINEAIKENAAVIQPPSSLKKGSDDLLQNSFHSPSASQSNPLGEVKKKASIVTKKSSLLKYVWIRF